jgi:hypothetical protein
MSLLLCGWSEACRGSKDSFVTRSNIGKRGTVLEFHLGSVELV